MEDLNQDLIPKPFPEQMTLPGIAEATGLGQKKSGWGGDMRKELGTINQMLHWFTNICRTGVSMVSCIFYSETLGNYAVRGM